MGGQAIRMRLSVAPGRSLDTEASGQIVEGIQLRGGDAVATYMDGFGPVTLAI